LFSSLLLCPVNLSILTSLNSQLFSNSGWFGLCLSYLSPHCHLAPLTGCVFTSRITVHTALIQCQSHSSSYFFFLVV
jgi:hypothetical protein